MTDVTPGRPLPTVDRDSADWWAALARHELVLQQCAACATWRWPARAMCGRCWSFEWSWKPAAGTGTVASWIVNHHRFGPGFESPYAVVTVELSEQVDLAVIGSWHGDLTELEPGVPVRAVFDDVAATPEHPPPDPGAGEHWTLLGWRPAR